MSSPRPVTHLLARCHCHLTRPRCSSLRTIHTTSTLSARPAPRKSPRVRDAERAQERARKLGYPAPSSNPRVDATESFHDAGLLTEMKSKNEIPLSKEQAEEFTKEFAMLWNQYRSSGPWQQSLCEKYNILPNHIYTLATYAARHNVPVSPSKQVILNHLLQLACLQGDRTAIIHYGNLLLHIPKEQLSTHAPKIAQVEKLAASGEDAQAMTVLAMLYRRLGKASQAQVLLEKALKWPHLPSAEVTTSKLRTQPYNGHKPAESSNSVLQTNLTSPPPSGASLNLSFPGANEALRTLGELYLSPSQREPPPSQISQPDLAPFQTHAKQAFAIAAEALHDGPSYALLVPLLPIADAQRHAYLLKAASHGSEAAWRQLAGSGPVASSTRPAAALTSDDLLWQAEWREIVDAWGAAEQLEKEKTSVRS